MTKVDNQPAVLGARTRWRVDGWIAWRAAGGGSGLTNGGVPFAASYGASQAGVLASLDLSGAERRPQAYLRATVAPDRPRQGELAAGIGLRPLARLPFRLQAEVRASHSHDRTFVRPAALAVTEFAPIELPLRLRAEGYAQGGWVGGHFATPFVDGQARVDRQLASLGPASLRLGAGAWGGAQEGAARLDAGPSLTLDLRESAVPARVSVDYRQRIAGGALPGSGLAVTLSTGF